MTAAPHSAASLLAGVSLLIVDDDPDMLIILQEWFACFGCEAQTASSGFEAVKQARAHAYDVVITDLKMPGLSGLQLLAILKERDPAVEVILLTGEGTLDDAVSALREGNAFDFLRKPVRSLAGLNDTLVRALQRRRRIQAMDRLLGPPEPSERPAHLESLSEREAQILALVVQGLDNRAVGERLHISEKTIKNHLTRIYEKLKVKNRAQALALCFRHRLV